MHDGAPPARLCRRTPTNAGAATAHIIVRRWIMTKPKYIYSFDEGDGSDRMLLGGKGANLCAMTQIGLDVPPGFVITTAACLAYLEQAAAARRADGRCPHRASSRSSAKSGKGFGSAANPLLVSVRSGSAMSMPGMMDTILNLGLNAATLAGPDRGRPAIRASPGTRTGASSSCSARSRWAFPTRRSTRRWRRSSASMAPCTTSS